MTLIEAMRQQYTAEYEVAAQLGWTVDEKNMRHNGPRFIQHWKVKIPSMHKPIAGAIHIWKIRDGWMCADLGPSMFFKNHRKYKTAVEAMQSEHQKAVVVDEIISELKAEENNNVSTD